MTGLAFASGHLDSSSWVSEVALVREKLKVLRDVLITLGMQLVFRTTILLRHWT